MAPSSWVALPWCVLLLGQLSLLRSWEGQSCTAQHQVRGAALAVWHRQPLTLNSKAILHVARYSADVLNDALLIAA